MINDPYNTDPKARKYHFWRGVRSACIVLVPVVAVLVYLLNSALDVLVK